MSWHIIAAGIVGVIWLIAIQAFPDMGFIEFVVFTFAMAAHFMLRIVAAIMESR